MKSATPRPWGCCAPGHEESLLKASTELKNLQVDEARENLAGLERSKLLVDERIEYYSNLEKRSEKEKAAVKSLDAAELKRKNASGKKRQRRAGTFYQTFPLCGCREFLRFGDLTEASNLGASFSADAAKARGESAGKSLRGEQAQTQTPATTGARTTGDCRSAWRGKSSSRSKSRSSPRRSGWRWPKRNATTTQSNWNSHAR